MTIWDIPLGLVVAAVGTVLFIFRKPINTYIHSKYDEFLGPDWRTRVLRPNDTLVPFTVLLTLLGLVVFGVGIVALVISWQY